MKKILPISILSLPLVFAANLGLSNSVSAKILTPDGEMAMTIEEVFAFEEEAKTELKESCGDDLSCQQEEFFMRAETDPRYVMLDQLYNEQLLLTSFTPKDNSLSLLFQSKNNMDRWLGDDFPKDSLTKLRMGWSEKGTLRPAEHGGIKTDRTLMPAGFHYIYLWDDSDDSWSAPVDEVFTITALDGDLSLIDDAIIQYEFSGQNSGALGAFIVRDCISSPYYVDGMECRAVFTEEGNLIYLPYENNKPAYPNYLHPDDLDKVQENGANNIENGDNKNKNPQVLDDGSSNDAGFGQGLKAPDTSTINYDNLIREVEPAEVYASPLPWWLPVLIGSCSFIVIEIFVKNSQKIEKRP